MYKYHYNHATSTSLDMTQLLDQFTYQVKHH